MHACIHKLTHTYTHTCVRTTYIHTYVRTVVRTYVRTVHTYICTYKVWLLSSRAAKFLGESRVRVRTYYESAHLHNLTSRRLREAGRLAADGAVHWLWPSPSLCARNAQLRRDGILQDEQLDLPTRQKTLTAGVYNAALVEYGGAMLAIITHFLGRRKRARAVQSDDEESSVVSESVTAIDVGISRDGFHVSGLADHRTEPHLVDHLDEPNRSQYIYAVPSLVVVGGTMLLCSFYNVCSGSAYESPFCGLAVTTRACNVLRRDGWVSRKPQSGMVGSLRTRAVVTDTTERRVLVVNAKCSRLDQGWLSAQLMAVGNSVALHGYSHADCSAVTRARLRKSNMPSLLIWYDDRLVIITVSTLILVIVYAMLTDMP